MRIRLNAAILAACAFLGGAVDANADVFTAGLYTVINYSGAYPSFKSVAGVSAPSFLDGVEADAGWRFSPFYSVEASYDYHSGSKEFGGITNDVTLQSASLDALGYLPFGWGSPWALYGDVGGSAFFAHEETVSASGGDETRFGGRAGGGLQYQFSDNIGARAGARYEWLGLPDLKSMEVFTIGLVWQQQ
jgi:opacity protein-like surface antigen